MSSTSNGTCLCGASSYQFQGEANFAIRCFCRDCQQASGGGSMPQIGIKTDTFTSSGPIKSYSKKSDSGSTLTFHFCGDCGSPLFKGTSKMPDSLFVNAGSLETPPAIGPLKNVFEDRRLAWDTL